MASWNAGAGGSESGAKLTPGNVSTPPTAAEMGGTTTRWGKVKKSIINGTLIAVGLRPTWEEERHWNALSALMMADGDLQDTRVAPQDLVDAPRGIARVEADAGEPEEETPDLDLKPDLWKVAFQKIRAKKKKEVRDTETGVRRRVVADSAVELRAEEEVDAEMPPETEAERKKSKARKWFDLVTLAGNYVDGYGGLGGITRLLHFEYKKLDKKVKRKMDNYLLHKRPYYTYWLMTVHTLIMVTSLAIYGFAPYGWDLVERRATVRQTDLSIAAVSKLVVPSVWGGPPQHALVLLGALFAPCMRRDRQLFEGIDEDRARERDLSGCCVRRDGSGCFQAEQQAECQARFSDFINETVEAGVRTRAVCGTSPRTCLEPPPGIGGIWVPDNILTWPICRDDLNTNSSEDHLTCEVTSAPCCFGIQANCILTTREMCGFLAGRFHADAFLCSQVDCLNDICGLLPFREFNEPDQVYRLWIALFLHAGLIHLLLSLVFSFYVLRYIEKRLGWWRTAVIYTLSGIGGNLVSAYFAPYNPEVGPAGSVAGVIAYFYVFLIFESPLLVKPWKEALKLLGLSGCLFLVGIIPYVDNYAHLGGFVFGFFISGVIVPYGNFKKVRNLTKRCDGKNLGPGYVVLDTMADGIYDTSFLTLKLVMIFGGLFVIAGLFVLFFALLYDVQTTWVGFSYLTCIPFTSTICIDQQVLIRNRDEFIV